MKLWHISLPLQMLRVYKKKLLQGQMLPKFNMWM